jgi:hypothetical protein
LPQSHADVGQLFVLGLTDSSPYVEIAGVELRRGTSAAYLDLPIASGFTVRGGLFTHAGTSYITASAEPLLTEWWELLTELVTPLPHADEAPLLRAAIQKRPIKAVRSDGMEIPLSVTPPAADREINLGAVVALEGGIDGNLLNACHLLPAVVKCALDLMGEYKQLVGDPPEVSVAFETGQTLRLASVLDLCAEASRVINWTLWY